MAEMNFRSMLSSDWVKVAEIYKQGIETGRATFQQEVPSWEIWDDGHLKTCRIVAALGDEVCGWIALSPVSGRCFYAGVAEVSVYVGNEFRGKNIGQQLLLHVIEASEKENIWTLQAGIFPENSASLATHKKVGFREVGYRERIGKMNGIWRNTILIERRSANVGRE